jgi:NTP pyrophosphatase (non-canonical NTP hydrolase)
MTYHLSQIKKGILGESSKIQEELDELIDAEKQEAKIMIAVELSDLYGAIELYAEKFNLSMEDLKKMSDITKRAFKSGHRK